MKYNMFYSHIFFFIVQQNQDLYKLLNNDNNIISQIILNNHHKNQRIEFKKDLCEIIMKDAMAKSEKHNFS